MLRDPICCDAARSVARYFRLGAIGVEQARAHISFTLLIGKQPLHSVRADTVMTIANLARERRHISRRMHAFNDQKIVPASRGFRERDRTGHPSRCSSRGREYPRT